MFRHLHVLASEKRCVETIDVESRDPLHLAIKVTHKQATGASAPDLLLRTPCLTPELNSVSAPWPQQTGKPGLKQSRQRNIVMPLTFQIGSYQGSCPYAHLLGGCAQMRAALLSS